MDCLNTITLLKGPYGIMGMFEHTLGVTLAPETWLCPFHFVQVEVSQVTHYSDEDT